MNRDDHALLSGQELPEEIWTEAARWHFASESDAMDWDAFTLWLESDPRHRRAFDEIALTDAALLEHRGELAKTVEVDVAPAEDARVVEMPPRRRAWRWAGVAVAASLAAVIAVPQFMNPAVQAYATGGSSQQITLADGSTVLLAPRSKLTIEGRGQDHIDLSGGALFAIRHDPHRQLTVTAGDLSISDIGTRFDVQAQDRLVRVAVVEGNVQVNAQSMDAPVRLPAGQGLSYDGRAGTATVAAVNAGDVGSWKDGRLTYDNATLALVVGDLQRYAGVTVDVPPALRDRRFSGTLIVDNGDAALRDLVQLMGLRLGGHAGAWRLEQP
ncbi:FecR domain-containing protein [Novosphingobium sp. BL-8A]|uniref:FecR family protein n=1 Tax=Novosphingobium sp. BL-8A TaxID=3127639 RepID=UPI0037573A52